MFLIPTIPLLPSEKSTINKYLNFELGHPRKIRKTFYLSKDQMKKRVNFCNEILNKGISGEHILFTDETKIDLSPYVRDSICLSKEYLNKLKKGDLDIYGLINRPEKKFEKSIMIAGGVFYFGITNLIILEGILNEFAYGQAINVL